MDQPLPLLPLRPADAASYLDLLPVELRRELVAPLYLAANARKRASELESAIAKEARVRSLRQQPRGTWLPGTGAEEHADLLRKGVRYNTRRTNRQLRNTYEVHQAALDAALAERAMDEDSLPLDVYRQHKFIRKDTEG